MDEQEEQSPPVPAEVEQHQDVTAVVGDGPAAGSGYWHLHDIVRRSPEEIRRGEAPAYVRRRG
ncbi:hypothetical protein [Amycolatopsis sp. cmx-11-51]|uniref:hypothetical protein n=1 Tax=Amycolatopsis sp. cmx-11-51 TaxID=2785797 RepID=UPI0039E25D72